MKRVLDLAWLDLFEHEEYMRAMKIADDNYFLSSRYREDRETLRKLRSEAINLEILKLQICKGGGNGKM